MRRRLAASIFVTALAGAHCRTATAIRVTSYSDVDCAVHARVALVVARDPAGLATSVPSALSTKCAPAAAPFAPKNDMGSVLVAPVGSNDEPIAFALMQRTDGEPPESCTRADQAKNCIVARRQLHFSPHEEIVVPVELSLTCLGIECPGGQTCRKGQCVDDHLADSCHGCTEAELSPSSAPACGDTRGLQSGAPWPMAGYCSTRASRSGRTGPSAPNVRWTFKMQAIASMSPAVASDGTVYCGSNDHNVYAVDRNGHEKWHAQVGSNINDTSFVIGPDGTIYFGAADENAYAYTADGALKWTKPVGEDISLTPAVGADGTIYIVGRPLGGPTTLFAFVPADGTVKWSLPDIFGSGGVAVGQDGTLFVGATDNHLYALDPANGHTIWSAPTGNPPTTPSVGDDGTVYVADGALLYAFDRAGHPRWTATIDGDVTGMGIGPDGTIYAPQGNGKLYAIAPDGTVAWIYRSTPGNGWPMPPAVGADGTVYVGGTDGGVYAFTPAGTVQWKVQTGGSLYSQPAIGGDGTLFVVSGDFNLYAIGP